MSQEQDVLSTNTGFILSLVKNNIAIPGIRAGIRSLVAL